MRVAVVLEQCWHRVPGGTALAALRQVEAVTEAGGVDQVGVAARHSSPPRPAYRPSIPVEHLALPRRVLYESWHRARWPKVERATGPVDAIHATGYAVPPASAPLVSTMHDLAWRHDPGNFTKNGVMFFESGLKRVVEDAALVLCPSQATLDDCAAAGIGHERLRRRVLPVVHVHRLRGVRRRQPVEQLRPVGVGRTKRRSGKATSPNGSSSRRTVG